MEFTKSRKNSHDEGSTNVHAEAARNIKIVHFCAKSANGDVKTLFLFLLFFFSGNWWNTESCFSGINGTNHLNASYKTTTPVEEFFEWVVQVWIIYFNQTNPITSTCSCCNPHLTRSANQSESNHAFNTLLARFMYHSIKIWELWL